jgi:hypothetical protein
MLKVAEMCDELCAVCVDVLVLHFMSGTGKVGCGYLSFLLFGSAQYIYVEK